MASNRILLFCSLVSLFASTLTPSRSAGQTNYRLASIPHQELGGFGQQDNLPAPTQDDGNVADANQPMVINPAMLQAPQQGQELPALPNLDEDLPPAQTTVVREKFSGWKQAGTDLAVGPVSDPLRSNWVLIDATGKLSGSVVGLDGQGVSDLPLYLISGGKVAMETFTSNGGRFAFNNVQQGSYSLVGFGKDSFFAFGMLAIDHQDALVGKMKSNLNILACGNSTTINLDWIRFFAPKVNFRVLGRHDSPQTAEGPAELYGLEGIATMPPNAIPATSISSHEVALQSDGRLVGRLHQFITSSGRPVDVRNTRVMLLANDDVVAATDADNFGVFRFRGISPGRYSLVGASEDGLGCIGINVVNMGSIQSQPQPKPMTDLPEGAEGEQAEENLAPEYLAVDFCLLPPEATGWLNHLATEEAYLRIMTRDRPSTDENKSDFYPPICYNTPNGCFRQFFRSMTSVSDMIFYGETNPYRNGNGNGGYGGYGNGGYGYGNGGYGYGGYDNGGYGYGGYGGYGNAGCNCGGAGCSACHQGHGTGCGACGGTGCQMCHPMMAAPYGSNFDTAPPVPSMPYPAMEPYRSVVPRMVPPTISEPGFLNQ